MFRYNVDITNGPQTVYTFTWAADIEEARRRVSEELASAEEVWEGWTADVKDRPAAKR